jgi:hypothetical protein
MAVRDQGKEFLLIEDQQDWLPVWDDYLKKGLSFELRVREPDVNEIKKAERMLLQNLVDCVVVADKDMKVGPNGQGGKKLFFDFFFFFEDFVCQSLFDEIDGLFGIRFGRRKCRKAHAGECGQSPFEIRAKLL